MVYVINGEHLTRRKLITIDGSKVTTETGIPIGLNINLPGVKIAGADVRLAKLDGTPIAREIECKDVPNTDDIMIWYPWDTTTGQDDQFWVYWGNQNLTEPAEDATYGREAVWNSNYVGVWHMNGDPSDSAPQLTDSTLNDNDGTSNGLDADDLVDSLYGKMTHMEVDEFWGTGTSVELDLVDNIDLLADINLPTGHANGGGVRTVCQGTDLRYQLTFNNDGTLSFYVYSGGWRSVTTTKNSWSADTEYQIRATFDKVNIKLFIDNSADGSTSWTSSATSPGAMEMQIGRYGGAQSFIGSVVEVRQSNTQTSTNFRTTTYNNLRNPTSTGTAPFYKSFGLSQHQRRVPQFIN